MLKPAEHIVILIALIISQLFIFDKINIFGHATIYLYIMYVMILPSKIRPVILLLIGFGVGALMDISTGKLGLCAMALTFTALIRPSLLIMMSGPEFIDKEVIPTAGSIGQARFIVYALIMSLSYTLPYVLLENMTLTNIGSTMLRIIFSTIATTAVIYLCHLPLIRRTAARR